MISSMSLFDFHPLFTIRSRITSNRQSIFRRPHVASSFTRHSIQAIAQVKTKLQVVNRCFVSLLLTKINRRKGLAAAANWRGRDRAQGIGSGSGCINLPRILFFRLKNVEKDSAKKTGHWTVPY